MFKVVLVKVIQEGFGKFLFFLLFELKVPVEPCLIALTIGDEVAAIENNIVFYAAHVFIL